MEVKFLDLNRVHSKYSEEIENSIISAVRSNNFILGPSLHTFEKAYAQYCNSTHCLGVGNGLDALTISLKALGISAGDEVIIPSNTFIATALAVSAVGAKPVLVDPDPKTFNITSKGISNHLSKLTKAIIPVHLFGQACEMQDIIDLARSENLFVIEDNAQSQGAKYKGKPTGSFGILNCTSFYPGKNLGAFGDGGAITTNSNDLFELISKFRNYGSTIKYHHDILGTNSRLDELLASALIVKLKYLDEQNHQRNIIANTYNSLLSNLNEIALPYVFPDSTHVYHLFVIKANRRDELQSYLKSKGVHTMIHYPIPIHKQLAYKNAFSGNFPIAEMLSNEILSLPIYPGLSENEVHYVCETIKLFYNK